MEDIIMGATNQDQEPPTDDDDNKDNLETQRSIVRQSLDEIANDVGIAMRDANLKFPFGLTVPGSGSSLVTMVTPIDPSDDDWSQTTDIVRKVVGKKLGGMRLRCRPLSCAIVNETMTGAEIVSNALAFDLPS
jgi:hypothetical protein